jgi:hypothetical protein
MGMSLFGGVPAALAVMVAAPPVGIALLGASALAFAHGRKLEQLADFDRHSEEVREATELRERQREEELQALRGEWDREEELLYVARDTGAISEEEFDAKWDELMDRWPAH